jgi:hypothetical protein
MAYDVYLFIMRVRWSCPAFNDLAAFEFGICDFRTGQ